MKNWFSFALDMNSQMLKAQQAQLKAAQKLIEANAQLHDMQRQAAAQMLDGARKVQEMQAAGQKAAEANVNAMRQWTTLWGM